LVSKFQYWWLPIYNLTICFKTGSPWSCKNGSHPYF
jgi:hypothetical protein